MSEHFVRKSVLFVVEGVSICVFLNGEFDGGVVCGGFGTARRCFGWCWFDTWDSEVAVGGIVGGEKAFRTFCEEKCGVLGAEKCCLHDFLCRV